MEVYMKEKHLSLSDRKVIQKGIEEEISFSQIGNSISKNHTTISREIKKHRIFKESNHYGRITCSKFFECNFKYFECYKTCKNFSLIPCRRRDKFYACNGCKELQKCRLDKYFYYAGKADESYLATLVNSRSTRKLSDEKIEKAAELLKPLLKQKQSPYQICINHPELNISAQTLYNYIHEGRFKKYGIDLFSLRSVVSRKPRNKKTNNLEKRSSTYFRGREYKDYIDFKNLNPSIQTTEMDTVYNSPKGPYIQTFIFEATGFMIGILHKAKTSESMSKTLSNFQDILTNKEFQTLFSLILTDRGSEFERYDLFEVNYETGEIRSNIFYCDPQRPDQKAHVENNHNRVRDCIPNKLDLTPYTQADINNVFSHINSLPRKSLNDHTPYEMFEFMYGEGLANKFGIKKIPKDKVTLNPTVLFKN